MSRARVSFEFFPPQSLDASFKLWETVQMLAPLAPDFVSVTSGAAAGPRAAPRRPRRRLRPRRLQCSC